MSNIYAYGLIGLASIMYVIVLCCYYFKEYNPLIKMADFKKFLVGPLFILFVYGLLLFNIVQGPDNDIFWHAVVLASAFIIYYGVTKIFLNAILKLNNRLIGDNIESQNYI